MNDKEEENSEELEEEPESNSSEEVESSDEPYVDDEDLKNKEIPCSDVPRKSERIRMKPRYLDDYATLALSAESHINYALLALSAESYVDDVPSCFEEIHVRDDRDEWKCAVEEEIKSLKENETWELTKLPPGRRAIDCKWIFKIKRNNDGGIERYKARLVIKGCAQRKGFDYEETYAPVARLTTLRVLLSIINQKNLCATQMDVKNAFLHGTLEQEIFMKVPPGFDSNKEEVCRLKKALYGLKQAPRAWNKTFDKFVKNLEFKQSEVDKCLYILKSGIVTVYLLLYVDDMIIAGNSKEKIEYVKSALEHKFHMKDLGELHSFLGISITRSEKEIMLSQQNYLRNLLKRFKMEDCKSVSTPM